ncbi:MAG: hypothetical protein WCD44_01170 [Candidatus Babeliales bacterium]
MKKKFFITYLLFITITIPIHTAEECDETAQELSVMGYLKEKSSQFPQNSPKVETFNDFDPSQEFLQPDDLRNIRSLDELTTLTSNRILNHKKRGKGGSSITIEQLQTLAENMIGNEVNQAKISPEVFMQWANKEGIIKDTELSRWNKLKSSLCCRSQNKNPFTYKAQYQPHEYTTLSKQLATIITLNQGLDQFSQKTRGGHRLKADNDDEKNDNEDNINLPMKLLEAKITIAQWEAKEKFRLDLQAILDEQKEKEGKGDTIKGILYAIAGIAGSFAAGALGLG